jgi:hypothetical protein
MNKPSSNVVGMVLLGGLGLALVLPSILQWNAGSKPTASPTKQQTLSAPELVPAQEVLASTRQLAREKAAAQLGWAEQQTQAAISKQVKRVDRFFV